MIDSSQAMVLAASNDEHTAVELLAPPDGAAIGERVVFEGHPGDTALLSDRRPDIRQ